MNKKVYLAILTIKIKAPQGYTPRTMSTKCGYIIAKKTSAILDKIKSEELERTKKIVAEKMPNIKMTIAATFEFITLGAISAQYITPLNDN